MIKYYRGVVFIVLQTAALSGVELLITESGNYELGASLMSLPAVGPDTIITISANDVTFDLGGQIISQGNATAGIDGILVMPGMSNVTIQNGTIRGVSGTAIAINALSARIVIKNILFIACGRALNVASSNGFELERCRFYNCSNPTGNMIAIFSSTDVLINNNFIVNAAYPSGIVQLNNCRAPIVKQLVCTGSFINGAGVVVFFDACTASLAVKLILLNGILAGGGGIRFINGAGDALLDTLVARQTGGTFCANFNLETAAVVGRCTTLSHFSNQSALTNFSFINSTVFCDSCAAINSLANGPSVSLVAGYLLSGGTSRILCTRSIGSRNKNDDTNIFGRGVGMDASLMDILCVVDGIFDKNVGMLEGAGIRSTGVADQLLLKNRAFANRLQLGASQYSGVNPGAVTHVASTAAINSAASRPWTNLSVPN